MKRFRQYIAIRFLWLAMAFHILNVSVDTADVLPAYRPENLSINDKESFAELFLEDILGIKNAILEYDEQDSETINQTLAGKFVCSQYTYKGNQFHFLAALTPEAAPAIFFEYPRIFINTVYTELVIPPPKFATKS